MSSKVINIIITFCIGGALVAGCESVNTNNDMDRVMAIKKLGFKKFVHMAVVVNDVDKAAKNYAAMFGIEEPKSFMTESAETAKTEYHGKPTKARAKLAFLKVDNMTFELIEPVGKPSTWNDALTKNGQSVHHIAFDVKGIDEQIALMESNGFKLIQQGRWTDGNGGRYAYLDTTEQLGTMLELLESF